MKTREKGMITIELAQQLKQAGLIWRPVERDCFAIPDRGFDGQVFVVSQFTALIGQLSGQPVITFHGSSEWALDHLLIADAVWMPSETQLREFVERLAGDGAELSLTRHDGGYQCRVTVGSGVIETFAASAEDAYGRALLLILRAPS